MENVQPNSFIYLWAKSLEWKWGSSHNPSSSQAPIQHAEGRHMVPKWDVFLLRIQHQMFDCTLLLKVEDNDSSSTGESSLRLRKGVFGSISPEQAKKSLLWWMNEPELTTDTYRSKVKLHLSAGSLETAFSIKAHAMQNLSVAAECWGQ